MVKNLYSENESIAQLSINILNRLAKISWASGGIRQELFRYMQSGLVRNGLMDVWITRIFLE